MSSAATERGRRGHSAGLGVALLVACAAACGQVDARVSASAQGIIGGIEDLGDPAVVMLLTPDGMCSGTLVAPRVVLTAAHCIASGRASGTVSFGDRQGDFFATRRVVDVIAHRRYSAGLFSGFDIGLIRLDTDAPPEVAPVPMNSVALDGSILGQTVRAVGFGVSDGAAQTGSGVKRTVFLTVTGLSDEHLLMGNATSNTCQGDSGGPILYTVEGVESIVAVTSFGQAGCAGESSKTRVDVYLDGFIREVVAAWDGPCQLDGICVEDCGAYGDPDCDVCGLDGVCGDMCARVDLDCPLAGLAGAACTGDHECESRLCVSAPDDDRVRYCSSSCVRSSDCAAPITICGERGVCEHALPTPSSQGAACAQDSDCRGGICDPDDAICVEPCGEGLSVCGEGYVCKEVDGRSACRVPGGGGCSIIAPGSAPGAAPGSAPGGRGASGTLILALALLALLWRRRVPSWRGERA
jgi:hypothetical protein